MNSKKTNFFIKLKDAIFNFDEYKNFAYEKLSVAGIYFLELMIAFAIIISLAICIKGIQIKNKISKDIINNYPNFKLENNLLTLEDENKRFIKDYKEDYKVIIDTNVSNLEEIEEANTYSNLVVFLKDKVVFKDNTGTQNSALYEEIAKDININKQVLTNVLTSKSIIFMFIMAFLVMIPVVFILFSIQVIISIIFLSIIGIIFSAILRIRLPYEKMLNISIYSMTLPIVLNIIYKTTYLFTGFDIIYFDIAYRAISYVYLLTALLIIKSELIKQNMELTKIIQVQKQVKEELEKKKEEEEQEKQEENKEKKKREKEEKKEDNNTQEPEGNQA